MQDISSSLKLCMVERSCLGSIQCIFGCYSVCYCLIIMLGTWNEFPCFFSLSQQSISDKWMSSPQNDTTEWKTAERLVIGPFVPVSIHVTDHMSFISSSETSTTSTSSFIDSQKDWERRERSQSDTKDTGCQVEQALTHLPGNKQPVFLLCRWPRDVGTFCLDEIGEDEGWRYCEVLCASGVC